MVPGRAAYGSSSLNRNPDSDPDPDLVPNPVPKLCIASPYEKNKWRPPPPFVYFLFLLSLLCEKFRLACILLGVLFGVVGLFLKEPKVA